MKFRVVFLDGSQFWIKARRAHTQPCDGAGCQHLVEPGEWYWREHENGLKLCRRCAEGTRWIRVPRFGVQEEMIIGPPPSACE